MLQRIELMLVPSVELYTRAFDCGYFHDGVLTVPTACGGVAAEGTWHRAKDETKTKNLSNPYRNACTTLGNLYVNFLFLLQAPPTKTAAFYCHQARPYWLTSVPHKQHTCMSTFGWLAYYK